MGETPDRGNIISMSEIRKAVSEPEKGRVEGADGVHVEIIQYGERAREVLWQKPWIRWASAWRVEAACITLTRNGGRIHEICRSLLLRREDVRLERWGKRRVHDKWMSFSVHLLPLFSVVCLCLALPTALRRWT